MTMRGNYRGIYSVLLDDLDYQALTPEARLVLLTLRLCALNNAASMFRLYPEILRSQTGFAAETLAAALAELERSPSPEAAWIVREGPVVWIRNGLRYDPNIKLADKKHLMAVERAISGLPKLSVVSRFCDYYRIRRAFDGPSEALPRPFEGVSHRGEERRGENNNNPPPKSSANGGEDRKPFTYPPGASPETTKWTPASRWPYEAFRHDCPDPLWRGHCVRADYAATHESYPAKADGSARRCPDHAS